MEKLFKYNWSIQARLILFFIFFGITISTSHFLTRDAFDSLEKYQVILNKANQNRDYIDQIAIHTNQILANRTQAKALLTDDIARFQINLDLLKRGGEELLNNKRIHLPPCEASLLPQLQQIENLWNQYRTKAEYILAQETFTNISKEGKNELSQSINQSAEYIEQNRGRLTALKTQFINAYADISETRKNQVDTWLLALLFLNLFLIVIGFILIHSILIQPLRQIRTVAKQIGEGELNKKVNYTAKNEVGVVALAINDMVDKIKNATDFIKSIEKGDLSVSYTGANGHAQDKDTLAGALLNMREKMKTVAIEEEERNWSTKGQALFGEILQTYNDDTETLSYEIISNLVKYLDANQGGLFIVNDNDLDNIHLDLIASYAFNRRRYLEKVIKVGEGLVGQSFKDADTIYITDIPENYVDITSGLGGAQPKSVLVVPLKLSDRVYGAMEIASFYEIKEYQIQFLEKLSENIASNLYAARANEQTKKLLSEYQKIAERLSKQEQEIRANLQAREQAQVEMQKNQEALAVQSMAIKSTLITVELGIDRKILTANDLFLQATKYSLDEIIGRDHSILVPDNQTDNSNYERLWRDLKAGIARTGEFKRLDKFGNEIWLRATYSPIKDKNGNPFKVLKLAFDVTEDKKLRLDFKEQLDSFRRSSAIIEFDINGKIIEVNENFLDLMEYNRDQIIGQEHSILVPQEERDSRAYQALWHKLRQGSYHIGEVKLVTKTGRTIWFQGSFNPILDLNGKPYKIIEVIIDITDRKTAESKMWATQAELQAKEANLIALLNNTDDAIYTINPNYRITLLNDSTRKLFEKIGAGVRVSSNVLESLPKNYYYIWKAYYDRALGGDKFSIEQAIFSEETAQKIYLSVYFNPIIADNQELKGVAIFARDITARKQRELDIAEFTKKQATRTARIIENQKLNFQNATQQYETELKQLKLDTSRLQKQQGSSQSLLNFLLRIDTLAICINQDYLIIQMNDRAKKTFREWNFYLQPDYLLTDTFPQVKFEAWKNHLDRAFDGEQFSITQIFRHKISRSARAFVINFTPIKDEIGFVNQVFITGVEITQAIKETKKRKIKTKNPPIVNQPGDNYQKNVEIFQQLFGRIKKGDNGINKPTQQVLDNQQIKTKDKELPLEVKELVLPEVFHAKLATNNDELAILIDKEAYVIAYNSMAWSVIHRWRLYLQPQYYLPDLFPMKKFSDWFELIQRGLNGENFTVREIFIHRTSHKIFIFEIQFVPEYADNQQVNGLVIKAKDVSAFVNPKQIYKT
jgi:PAS domain S-box-containing protein